MKKINLHNQSGQAFILAIIVFTVLTLGVMALASGAFTFKSSTKYNLDKLEASSLADAGIDKAVATFNTAAVNYNGEPETQLGPGSYEVTVTTVNPSTKLVESTGYIPNKAQAKITKKVSVQVSKGEGVSFGYGVQTGVGGLLMQQSSTVTGSIYSNGNIDMYSNARVTGDAFVAGGVQPSADQQNEGTCPNCSDFEFGRVSGGQVDAAQAFVPSQSGILNKVAFKLKKSGTPPDITVRILGDSSNKPNKNDVKASGTLYASLVTSQYNGWVEVAFSTPPNISSGTKYWIMLDTSANSSNYWQWFTDTLSGYTPGGASWSPNWQAGNPDWYTVNGDFGFQTYMGGVATHIQGANGATIGGNAHANTLADVAVTGDAYYQIISNVTAADYHPGSTDPTQEVMPISDANIEEWKETADGENDDQIETGDITTCVNFASKKYVGNVTLPNGCISTVQSPVWITGTLTLTNGAQMRLDSSFGAGSGVIVVDGKVTLDNNASLNGTGTTGSYLMALTTFDSTSNGQIAIEAYNGSNSTILYANDGIILLHNNAALTEITAWKIELDNNATVTYSNGLASTFFSSKTGAYTVVKGTYQSK